MANAEIVAIGSELLLGQIVDTSSAWMAQRLTALGVNLYFKSVVGDNPGASKVTKAESLGGPMLDEDGFEHLLATGELPGQSPAM